MHPPKSAQMSDTRLKVAEFAGFFLIRGLYPLLIRPRIYARGLAPIKAGTTLCISPRATPPGRPAGTPPGWE